MSCVRRGRRTVAVAVAAAAFATWPFADRYTSFGIDVERHEAGHVRCDWWRVRWPGDGTVGLCHEVGARELASGLVEPFDLGGVFFANAAPPGARDTMALAVPHALLVVLTTLLAGATFLARRTRTAR